MLIRRTAELVEVLGPDGSVCYGPIMEDVSKLRWHTFNGGVHVHAMTVAKMAESGDLEPIAFDLIGRPTQYRLARLAP